MDDLSITEDEYARWLMPRDALKLVGGETEDWEKAARDILRRAYAGKIKVCAEDITIRRGFNVSKLPPFSRVPDSVLRNWTGTPNQAYLNFWTSAGGDCDVVINVRADGGMGTEQKHYELFGIRFEPTAINRLADGLPLSGARPEQTAEPQPSHTETLAKQVESPQEKRPVSKPDLARWAEVFVKVHPDFAEPFALQSARAMFPDKFVGRDRMRQALTAVAGPRKRGPKAAK